MMENIKRITINDFHRMEIAAKQSVENIPDGHCRIKEEIYNRKLINLCENAKTRTDGKIKYIIVTENYNQGNARYPHNIKKVITIKFDFPFYRFNKTIAIHIFIRCFK